MEKLVSDKLATYRFKTADRILGKLIAVNADYIPGFADMSETEYNVYYEEVQKMIRQEIAESVK